MTQKERIEQMGDDIVRRYGLESAEALEWYRLLPYWTFQHAVDAHELIMTEGLADDEEDGDEQSPFFVAARALGFAPQNLL